MPDRLCGLVKTIIGSFPIKDPHAQQRQQQWIVDLCLIDHMEPFSPADHVGPQPIIKEQVWEDVVPPVTVSGCLVLPLLADPMKGILGDLQNSPQHFSKQKQRGELPHVLLGNVPTQTLGYAPHYQTE